MYRVALCAGAALAMAACSLGSESISSGYNQPDTTASINSSPNMQGVALGGEPSAPRAKTPAVAGQQYAALDQARDDRDVAEIHMLGPETKRGPTRVSPARLLRRNIVRNGAEATEAFPPPRLRGRGADRPAGC